jgi:hypothetical protein
MGNRITEPSSLDPVDLSQLDDNISIESKYKNDPLFKNNFSNILINIDICNDIINIILDYVLNDCYSIMFKLLQTNTNTKEFYWIENKTAIE